MKARYFTPDDYQMAVEWWKAWRWPVIPLNFLPHVGVVVSNNDAPVCMAWIYCTDSDLCMFEFFISDRNADRETRKGSIEFLLAQMETEAKQRGYRAAFMSVQNQSLIKKARAAGFSGEETGMTNLTRVF